VTLATTTGLGGRNQELALAAAEALAGAAGPLLLAAGTDGRDGPTDAAGAFADGNTWRRVSEAGRDPSSDLARHDSHAALGAAGDLFRTGMTGTNVMDLVLGLVPMGRSGRKGGAASAAALRSAALGGDSRRGTHVHRRSVSRSVRIVPVPGRPGPALPPRRPREGYARKSTVSGAVPM
jgi:hypothetical protein